MRFALCTTALAIFVLALPAAAKEAVEKVETEPTKMICKRSKATGTRLKNKRVCAPASEWAQRAAHDQEEVNRLQYQQTGGACELTGC